MYTSALTTTIVGVLRGVFTIILGFMLDTVKFHILNVIGITINTCGGVWYTWLKYLEKYGQGGGSKLPSKTYNHGYSKVDSEEREEAAERRVSDGGKSPIRKEDRV